MKKALVPMIVTLALCGAGATALVVNTARAQAARKPVTHMMPADQLANGPPGRHEMHRPDPAERAARHKQMCEDGYAHQVGNLAYLETKLDLTAAQRPAFDRWKSVKLDIARRNAADCATRPMPSRDAQDRPTPLDRMAQQEDRLKRRLADLGAERPVLSALYNALSPEQKMEVAHAGAQMMMRHGGRFGGGMGPRHGHMEPPGMDGNRPPMPDGPPPQ